MLSLLFWVLGFSYFQNNFFSSQGFWIHAFYSGICCTHVAVQNVFIFCTSQNRRYSIVSALLCAVYTAYYIYAVYMRGTNIPIFIGIFMYIFHTCAFYYTCTIHLFTIYFYVHYMYISAHVTTRLPLSSLDQLSLTLQSAAKWLVDQFENAHSSMPTCNPYLRHFGCAIAVPPCNDNRTGTIPPCRELCEGLLLLLSCNQFTTC